MAATTEEHDNRELVEEQDNRELGGGSQMYYDGSGFMSFEEDIDWSNSALMAHACFNTNNGPMVTYSMYTDGHNGCTRKKLGTYTTGMLTYLKANGAQATKDAEYTNGKYQGYDIMMYLYCTAAKVNNVYFYYKLGCSDKGNGISVLSYKDPYCTERAGGYSSYFDSGLLQASFNYCKKCTFSYSTYGSYSGGDGYSNYYYKQNNKNSFPRHQSPLCGAMWAYKENCNYTCKKNQKKALAGNNAAVRSSGGGGSSFGSGFGYDESYSPMEDFLLWGLSLSALFFLMRALMMRKRFSKQVRQEELHAFENAGMSIANISRFIIFLAIFITLMVVEGSF